MAQTGVGWLGRILRYRYALLILLLFLGYPLLDHNAGHVNSAADAAVFILLAVGLSIVVGFAGLLDLGYAAFFAIGSYTAALLTSSGSQLALLLPEAARNPWVALPIAGVVTAGFGLIFGVPTIRTRGEYLAI